MGFARTLRLSTGLVALAFCGSAAAQVTPAAPNTDQPSAQQSAQPAAESQQPDGQQPPIANGSGSDQDSTFVFKKQVNEVVLHATVVDGQGELQTHLDRSAFSVFEDGVPQVITSFRRQDVPVAIGVVIDNSGSMRDKRAQVNRAVMNLIKASNPQDEVFVVNFSSNPYLDQDFTSDANLLEHALHQASMKGSTALYDAVVASDTHLKNNRRLDKKVLLVITDGKDNMSRNTLQEAQRDLQQENGPTLYAIGLMSAEIQASSREALEKLANATGGAAFFPDSLDQVSDITRSLARDIRSQYIIAYRPHVPNPNADYHPIRVEAHPRKGAPPLVVRTRKGIYTGESVR
jgi:Ca-activated chloride channel family protein